MPVGQHATAMRASFRLFTFADAALSSYFAASTCLQRVSSIVKSWSTEDSD
jgi:hypothetical protein